MKKRKNTLIIVAVSLAIVVTLLVVFRDRLFREQYVQI